MYTPEQLFPPYIINSPSFVPLDNYHQTCALAIANHIKLILCTIACATPIIIANPGPWSYAHMQENQSSACN